MLTFMLWFGRNRKRIGYTIGGVNLATGLVHLATDNILAGICWTIIGAAILFDTREFK